MADRDWLCVNCEQHFKSGDWFGCRGNKTRKHVVETKIYYSDSDRLMVNAVPSGTLLGNQGERIPIAGIIVTFLGGTYHTADPQVQEVLDVRCPMTKDQYLELRTTEAMKVARLRQKVDEQQVLIEQLKAKVAEKKAAPAVDQEAEPEPVMAQARRTRAAR